MLSLFALTHTHCRVPSANCLRFQILKTNHESVGGQQVASPYVDFLRSFSFLTLDVVTFVPLSCMWEDHL